MFGKLLLVVIRFVDVLWKLFGWVVSVLLLWIVKLVGIGLGVNIVCVVCLVVSIVVGVVSV